MTTILYWVYAALIAAGTLLNIGSIGKPRPPLTPSHAVGLIIMQAPLIYLLIRAALAGV